MRAEDQIGCQPSGLPMVHDWLQATARGGTAGTAREPHATSFPETIPEETSSIEEEHVMIFRLGSLPEEEEDELQGRPKVYKVRTSIASDFVSVVRI